MIQWLYWDLNKRNRSTLYDTLVLTNSIFYKFKYLQGKKILTSLDVSAVKGVNWFDYENDYKVKLS